MPTPTRASRAVSRRFDVATAQVAPAAVRVVEQLGHPGIRAGSGEPVLARFHSR